MDFEAIATFIGGIVVIMLMIFIISLIVSTCTSPMIEIQRTYNLVALSDFIRFQFSGTFFLATGCVSGGNQYKVRYAVANHDDTVSIKEQSLEENIFFRERDDLQPQKIDYVKIRKVWWLPWLLSRNEEIIDKTIFVVPPHTISSDFTVDLK